MALLAADLVAHFEKRVEAMIVCMSLRICVDLYEALIRLRPEWAGDMLKVVMTSSAEDGPEWQKQIGSKEQRRDLAHQFKNIYAPCRIVFVRNRCAGRHCSLHSPVRFFEGGIKGTPWLFLKLTHTSHVHDKPGHHVIAVK